jgi:hypothetical protein
MVDLSTTYVCNLLKECWLESTVRKQLREYSSLFLAYDPAPLVLVCLQETSTNSSSQPSRRRDLVPV